MSKLYFYTFLMIMFITFSITKVKAENKPWVLSRNSEDIKVFLRTQSNSEFKEFKGEVIIKSSVEEALKLIKNYPLCSEWQYKCENIFTLNNEYILKINNLPWPLKKRYIVFKLKEEKKAKSTTIFFKSVNIKKLPSKVNIKIPQIKDYVEIIDSEGFWEVLKIDDNNIKITYQMHSNPGNSIPANIINMGIVNAPYHTLLKMREILQK